jgi:hypothetical protein
MPVRARFAAGATRQTEPLLLYTKLACWQLADNSPTYLAAASRSTTRRPTMGDNLTFV